MAKQFTSIQSILERILRDHLFDGLTMEAAIDYCVDFIEIVGVPDSFEDKSIIIPIESYRAELPLDFIEAIQVIINKQPARGATDTMHNFYNQYNMVNNYTEQNPATYRATGDTTYKIAKGYIYSSIEKGEVNLIYRCIPTDTLGIPMIPDDRVFFRALQAFIELKFLTILWRNQKVTDKVFQQAEQSYAWAVGAYETHSRKLDLGNAEALFNSFRTLVIRDNEFSNRFRNLGSKEILKNK